jgi:hypothetical protein
MAVNETSTQMRAQPQKPQVEVATGEATSAEKIIVQSVAILITIAIISTVAYGLNYMMTMG